MTSTKDVMVDLELLAVTFDATIIQIGAVQFNIHDKDQSPDKYRKLLIEVDPIGQNRKINPEQIQFWVQQEIKPPSLYEGEYTSLKDALIQFNEWLPDNAKTRLWANGHDYFILQNAYQQLGIDWKIPWRQFYNYRVIRDLFAIKNYPHQKYERFGTYHNALDDSITQAVHLQKMVGALPNIL